MAEHDAARVAETFWAAVVTGDWDGAAALLHDGFVQEWPQSGERIVGKENSLAIDRNFPGGMPKITVRRVRTSGDMATMEIDLVYADGSRFQGVSILELRDGKIVHETDYFAQPFAAPQWRAQWVERM
jgi:ketosteroid isomerase-like protein